MHEFINTLHSYNRYLLLIALVFVLYRSYTGWLGKKPFEKTDNTASVALLGLTHLQALLGLIQYFVTSGYTRSGLSIKDPWVRYFKIEHIAMMLLAVACIQVGRSLSKKASDPNAKHRKLAIWTTVAVVLILAALVPKGLLFNTLEGAVSGQ